MKTIFLLIALFQVESYATTTEEFKKSNMDVIEATDKMIDCISNAAIKNSKVKLDPESNFFAASAACPKEKENYLAVAEKDCLLLSQTDKAKEQCKNSKYTRMNNTIKLSKPRVFNAIYSSKTN